MEERERCKKERRKAPLALLFCLGHHTIHIHGHALFFTQQRLSDIPHVLFIS
jgi:hypothetical protein